MHSCCHHSDQPHGLPTKHTDGGPSGSRQPSRLPFILWGAAAVVAVAWFYFFDVSVTPRGSTAALLKSGLAEGSADLPAALAAAVVPDEGYTVALVWGDTGRKLVEAGAIDLEKYQQNYDDEQSRELLSYLTETQNRGITITKDNAYFWVNTLWALGLTQQSDVLDAGVMATEYRDELGNFASTGGWTLGTKPATELYSSTNIVPLTAEQQTLVQRISANVYRPCCGNSTAFPDCNHGMAALGLIELMVSQGSREEDIYRAALAFNSYWFSQTYLDLAYYFQTKENTAWADVDPRRVLGKEFSSAQGYQAIKQTLGPIPGAPSAGSSCSA